MIYIEKIDLVTYFLFVFFSLFYTINMEQFFGYANGWYASQYTQVACQTKSYNWKQLVF